MTAKLTYEIIMTLPEKERQILLDMLEPQYEKFDVENFLLEEIESGFSDDELTKYLIETLFSKYKKT